MEAALGLLNFRGERVYIPKNLSTDHELVERVGQEAAIKLCSLFGGEVLFIPRAAVAKLHRNLQILEDAHTLSVVQLARKYGLGERQIYNLLRVLMSSQS